MWVTFSAVAYGWRKGPVSRYHKPHTSRTSDVWFVAIVLLVVTLYQHSDLLPITEHVLFYSVLRIIVVCILVLLGFGIFSEVVATFWVDAGTECRIITLNQMP
jgi:hypothetical protein